MPLDKIAKYGKHRHIYTDGSKSDSVVGTAAVMEHTVRKSSIPHIASIFTHELQALQLALNIIQECRSSKVVIFSDSLSAIEKLGKGDWDNRVIQRIMRINHLQDMRK